MLDVFEPGYGHFFHRKGREGGDKNSAVSDLAATTSCARFAQAWLCPDGFPPYQEGGLPAVRVGSE